MAAGFDNIQWKLIAQDAASAAYRSVIQAQKDLAKSSGDLDKKVKEGKQSWLDMAKGVVAGSAAYDALKQGVNGAVDFLKQSVEESIKGAQVMSQVKQNVENAGLSFDGLKGKLEEHSQAMIQMGFDDEDTSQSMGKLILVTGDYNKALAVNKIAMDLSRSKGIGLTEATDVLTRVIGGNNKVMKEYGIVLDDNATAGDALAAIQDKVKGSAAAFADTTAGKMEIVNQQWSNMKQAVGDQLTPAIADFMGQVSAHMPEIISLVSGLASGLGTVLGAVVKVVAAMGELWDAAALKDKTSVDSQLEKVLDQTANKYNEAMKKMGKAANLTGKEIATMDSALAKNLIDKYGKGSAEAADKTAAALKRINDATVASIGGPNKQAVASAQEARKKIVEALKDVSGNYTDLERTARENLVKLEADHRKNSEAISAKITDLKKQLTSLKTTYDETVGGLNKTEAEGIVAQEQKIADLEKRMKDLQAGGFKDQGDVNTYNEVAAELQKEKAAYASYTKDVTAIDADIKEARRRANETEFERNMEDLKVKREEAKKDYDTKKAQLDQEVADQEAAQKQEDIIFAAKRNAYKETMTALTAFHDGYTATMASLKAQTEATVTSMKDQLATLKQVIADIESERAKQSVIANATGPAGSSTTNNSASINIGSIQIKSQADADKLIKQITETINRQLQLSTMGSS